MFFRKMCIKCMNAMYGKCLRHLRVKTESMKGLTYNGEVVDNCPSCNKILKSKQITVNLRTFIMEGVCKRCRLTIKMDPTPMFWIKPRKKRSAC